MDSIDNKYVATLESRVDFLETELYQLNSILKRVGFPQGIVTLKGAAEEILAEDGALEVLEGCEESEF